LPFKLGLLLIKGLFVAFVALPLAAAGLALFVGLLAVGGVIGCVVLVLSILF